MMKWLGRFLESVDSVIHWFPIIWKDRDFDQYYLLKILEFKLKRMDDFFHSKDAWTDTTVEPSKTAIKRLHQTGFLIKYLMDERYGELAYQWHHEKYPCLSFDESIRKDELGQTIYVGFTRDGEKESFLEATEKGRNRAEKAENILFYILKTYYTY